MPPVSDWSTNPNDNTNVGGVNIAELCPPGNVNDGIRQCMAAVRAALTDTALGLLDDPSYSAMRTTLGVPASTDSLSSLAALTPSPDTLPYFAGSGAGAASLTPLTAFARALLDDGDAATARATLGVIGVAAIGLSNPGYIRFSLPGFGFFQVAWGTFSANANGNSDVNYLAAFPNAGFPVISGAGEFSPGAQDNNPAVFNAGAGGFSVYNASNACTCWYLAAGW